MICDYFRMISMDADDPHQVEDVMARELKKTLVEKMHPVNALMGMADGLPALGIGAFSLFTQASAPAPKNVILMIADGSGANSIAVGEPAQRAPTTITS